MNATARRLHRYKTALVRGAARNQSKQEDQANAQHAYPAPSSPLATSRRAPPGGALRRDRLAGDGAGEHSLLGRTQSLRSAALGRAPAFWATIPASNLASADGWLDPLHQLRLVRGSGTLMWLMICSPGGIDRGIKPFEQRPRGLSGSPLRHRHAIMVLAGDSPAAIIGCSAPNVICPLRNPRCKPEAADSCLDWPAHCGTTCPESCCALGYYKGTHGEHYPLELIRGLFPSFRSATRYRVKRRFTSTDGGRPSGFT